MTRRARRTRSSNRVAADLMIYLVDTRGITQSEISEALGVDKSFVSRVRAAERDLSTDQLRRLADYVKLPLGAMLLAASKPKPTSAPVSEERQKFLDLCDRLVQLADRALADMKTPVDASRKSA